MQAIIRHQDGIETRMEMGQADPARYVNLRLPGRWPAPHLQPDAQFLAGFPCFPYGSPPYPAVADDSPLRMI